MGVEIRKGRKEDNYNYKCGAGRGKGRTCVNSWRMTTYCPIGSATHQAPIIPSISIIGCGNESILCHLPIILSKSLGGVMYMCFHMCLVVAKAIFRPTNVL